MRKALIILCICFFFPFSTLLAQTAADFPILIKKVLVFGNDKTKEEVVLREIPFEFPAKLNLDDFQQIQNRLNNLFLFNRVELGVVGEGKSKILLIQLTESWYLLPVPLLFINERDWSKISYGFSVTHTNFRGMHEQLNVGGWLGYNPSFFLRYYNPWLGKKSRFILGINTFGKKVGNKFFDFDESHLKVGVTLGKRLNLNTLLQFSASFRRIKLPDAFKQYSVSGSGMDLIPKFGLQFMIDKRDLFEYPRSGYFLSWDIIRSGLTKNQPEFWRFRFDHRAYLKITDRISIAGKNLTTLTSVPNDRVPIYDRIFIGYLNRIRGYFNKVVSGRNLMMDHIEARISLLPMKYVSWKEAPLAPSFFRGLKYGLSLGIFMDSGIVWDEPNQFSLKNHNTGYGVGLHIHLPYIYLLRIDHAWNDVGQRQWIIEAGVVF